MCRIICAFVFALTVSAAVAIGVRVGPDCNILLTDSNPPGVVDSAILRWGDVPGDRSNSFTVTPVADTTCSAIGIITPGQYHIVAVAVAGGVEADESIEVPFELKPLALILDVQP